MKSTWTTALFSILLLLAACQKQPAGSQRGTHDFNESYSGELLDRIAYPMGGMGAGMICLEGNASISQVSVRHAPDIFHEPYMFAGLAIRGLENEARVLEGPVPAHKIFGSPFSGDGASGKNYGFPRFGAAEFQARFPFARVKLKDAHIPLDVKVRGWSPFIPGQEDLSSLPCAGLEYEFTNRTDSLLHLEFSYHAENFMRTRGENEWGVLYLGHEHAVKKLKNGFILSQECVEERPQDKGDFAIFTLEDARVDYRWFRGGWFDSHTMLWRDIQAMDQLCDTATEGSTAASLYIPLDLAPGESRTVHLLMSWYVPHSTLYHGIPEPQALSTSSCCDSTAACCSTSSPYYEPWYSSRFTGIDEIATFWKENYRKLREQSSLFSETFYASDLPPEVLEAVSANLCILKSPTILRQKDGRLWAYEGCFDCKEGCCYGSCTHVWNYAQALPHLFPKMERSLRESEFLVSQDASGHQSFRTALPIQTPDHNFHAAADGQLGGMMKVYRDWRISGDTEWLKTLWPQVKSSYHYCSSTWDPKGKGVLEEPHHNTYDIEFWGPDGMCSSIYMGATLAMSRMAEAMGEDPAPYDQLLKKGLGFMEEELFNGEYYIQQTRWTGLQAPPPEVTMENAWNIEYSEEALELLRKEGPKYQYGTGCLSDGVIGAWLARVCGLGEFMESPSVQSHLLAVHGHNFRQDLSRHVNPQRPGFAMGKDGGLLLCSWPHGDMPSLPFVYSNEVWTGIEYQVASHLMMHGEVEKGLEIVRTTRKRYDGSIRNPFNEYECGHWYARAMASYALLQGLTGLHYDALEKTLHLDSKIGKDFSCFLSTESGYGLAGLKNGEPFLEVVSGAIEVREFRDHSR